MIKICQKKQIKKSKFICSRSLINYDEKNCLNLVRLSKNWIYMVFDLFCRKKSWNGLTWFLICFQKQKKWNMDQSVFFLCNFTLKYLNQIWKNAWASILSKVDNILKQNQRETKFKLAQVRQKNRKNLLSYSNWNMNVTIEIVSRNFLKINFLDLCGLWFGWQNRHKIYCYYGVTVDTTIPTKMQFYKKTQFTSRMTKSPWTPVLP